MCIDSIYGVFIAFTSANKNQQPTFNMDLNIRSPVFQLATLSTKPPYELVRYFCVGQIFLETDFFEYGTRPHDQPFYDLGPYPSHLSRHHIPRPIKSAYE
jgi:hypothetical protein